MAIPTHMDGGAGNDRLTGGLVGDLLRGGEGNDLLLGSAGDDILLGELGADELWGGWGRDVQVGDADLDRLFGGIEEDILIGGTTVHDDDDVALGAILAEWTSGRTFEQRIANLTDGSGTAVRANGDVFLTPGGTVLPDGAADELFGNLGRDWFFAFNEDLAQDFVEDVDVMA